MRTTIDIDGPILEELKLLQKQEGKSLGRLVSDLLARSLAGRKGSGGGRAASPKWVNRRMGALIDLEDKDTLYAALDQPEESE